MRVLVLTKAGITITIVQSLEGCIKSIKLQPATYRNRFFHLVNNQEAKLINK